MEAIPTRVAFSGGITTWGKDAAKLLKHYISVDSITVENTPDVDVVFVKETDSSIEELYTRFEAVPVRIFWGGEAIFPDFNIFDYAIGFAPVKCSDRYAQFHPLDYFSRYLSLGSLQKNVRSAADVMGKSRFCDFIYSNATAHPARDDFFEKLSRQRFVHSAGRHLNNVGLALRRDDWESDWREKKISYQEGSLFSICFENALMDGYTSEKLLTAMLAGSIPIYWGNPSVGELFNTNAFINCHDFPSFDHVVRTVCALAENPDECTRLFNQPWLLDAHQCRYRKQHADVVALLSGVLKPEARGKRQRPKGTWPDNYEQRYRRCTICINKDAHLCAPRGKLIERMGNRAKSILRRITTCRLYSSAGNLRQWLQSNLRERFVEESIRVKWFVDKLRLPLTRDHWNLYAICHRAFWRELRDFPNLVSPRDFNDRIQWLKLFDQTEEYVWCSDKVRVRDYVRERVGEQYLTQIYQTCDAFDRIDFDRLPQSFVIKTNHDSGGVVLVRDKAKFNKKAARNLIEENLRSVYGWTNGEWAYAFVRPQVLVEEFIAPAAIPAPADYKFHCADGKIKWLQYIYDRKRSTKEVIVSCEGVPMAYHFDHNMLSTRDFTKPSQWDDLCRVVEALADGWKYMRVDLYLDEHRIVVGELTFFPLFGCYKGEGQKALGQLLDFDRTTFKPPIYHKLKPPRYLIQRSE